MALLVSVAVAIFLCCQTGMAFNVTRTWVNSYDSLVSFACPSGQMIYRIKSQHSNSHEDRVWEFSCKSISESLVCHWTTDVNNYDEPMYFVCPENGVIGGAFSEHSNRHEDRIWQFRCCHPENGHHFRSCTVTPFVNNWDGWMEYSVPSGNYLTGVFSIHDNSKEDRRWKFLICE